MITSLSLIIGAYFLGSIPFGLIFSRMAGIDIRKMGSGNIGATNVLRTGKKTLAAMTLIFDMLKGMAPVLLALELNPKLALFTALMALLGHMFPCWLRFKGGKGVATYFGILLGLCWPVGIFAILVWVMVAIIMRISSLSALVSVGTSPIFYMIFMSDQNISILAFMVLLIIVKHADNITRLVNGVEPKIGQKEG